MTFALPTGYIWGGDRTIKLDPDEQVQQVVRLIFAQFDELGTLGGVLRYCARHDIRIGVRLREGPAVSRPPCRLETGKSGQLIRIPPGTPHAVVVVTTTARVLNFYVLGILDREIAILGTLTTSPVLPPAGTQTPPTPEQEKALTDRLHDLATQSWSSQTDLLAHLR